MIKQINKIEASIIICFILLSTNSIAQELEVDHLWIHIQSESVVSEILENVGFNIAGNFDAVHSKSTVIHHKGQGTAGIYVRFQNIYLEFIWIEDKALLSKIAPDLGSTLLDYPQTSPLGIGLRFNNSELVSLPFRTTSYWAEWMRPLDALAVAKREASTDPAIFVIPNWLNWAKRTKNKPELLEDTKHTIPVHNVTKIRVYGPEHPSQSEAVQYLRDNNLVEFQSAEEYLLELVFDNHLNNRIDLQPTLPLVIYY
ncbi:hypothetical protein [Aestuariivivens sediminicola]|uniref:hypothetical protein n=1 Tax=Aestuariivivens sediminicola TaxID=2913560 RepID=UPI001F5AE635|nr:hypothetical protein [Aestuariivivens sediminicola]